MREPAADFNIHENDLRPRIRVTATDSDGNPIDLTGAIGVRFNMARLSDGTNKIDAAAGFIDPRSGGVMEYAWVAGDTDEPGSYRAEFEVEWSAGTTETFPNAGALLIRVEAEAG